MGVINRQDIHILKYCSSFVSVSGGEVFYITDPKVSFCPLAKHFYNGIIGKVFDKEGIKKAIKEIIEFKIRKYGFFTANRRFEFHEAQVPYGASEMLMFALKNKVIDAAVVVCDGAGTVITDSDKIVQGIGARLRNIVITSPLPSIIEKLKFLGCKILSRNAVIDQFSGVKKAAELGYKTIGVTIDGDSARNLERLKDIEKQYNVSVISLVVCTTGVKKETVKKIKEYADLVWSCLSDEIHRMIAPYAKLQLSKLMPVFAISDIGVNFAFDYHSAGKNNRQDLIRLAK
ncbi:MAG: DUF2099 family protein [Candidatus Omnitrophica bacterium]|nr:DUF2099 family protein [Candidatus Omnitrophota bacterium]